MPTCLQIHLNQCLQSRSRVTAKEDCFVGLNLTLIHSKIPERL